MHRRAAVAFALIAVCGLMSRLAAHADTPCAAVSGPPLTTGRWAATATLLPGGSRVLIAGGYSFAEKNTLRSADLLDVRARKTVSVAPMTHDRNFAAAILLADGTVLVAGGYSEHCDSLDLAERYNPRTDRWTETKGYLNDRRELFSATPLLDGTVLIAGGLSIAKRHTLATAETYDPKTDSFTLTAAPMSGDRFGQAAVALADGRVMIVGGKSWKIGQADKPLASAEIYDPKTGKFTPTAAPLRIARDRPTASLLPDGRVLIAGGANGTDGTPAACETWDPATGLFSDAAPLHEGRMAHAACTLPDGRILVAGGWSNARKATTSTTELYDPKSNAWITLPDLPFASHDLCLVLLPDGRVLALGGKQTVGDEKTARSVASTALITIP